MSLWHSCSVAALAVYNLGMIGFDKDDARTRESSVTSKISQTLQLPTQKLQLLRTLLRNRGIGPTGLLSGSSGLI